MMINELKLFEALFTAGGKPKLLSKSIQLKLIKSADSWRIERERKKYHEAKKRHGRRWVLLWVVIMAVTLWAGQFTNCSSESPTTLKQDDQEKSFYCVEPCGFLLQLVSHKKSHLFVETTVPRRQCQDTHTAWQLDSTKDLNQMQQVAEFNKLKQMKQIDECSALFRLFLNQKFWLMPVGRQARHRLAKRLHA